MAASLHLPRPPPNRRGGPSVPGEPRSAFRDADHPLLNGRRPPCTTPIPLPMDWRRPRSSCERMWVMISNGTARRPRLRTCRSMAQGIDPEDIPEPAAK